MRRQVVLIACATALVATTALTGASGSRGRIQASTVLGGKRVEVVVRVDTLSDTSERRGQVWGMDDLALAMRRTTVVGALGVRVAGAELVVPLSSYADLGNPTRIRFRTYPKGFLFAIEGGDTTIGHGYEASVFVEDGAIVRRRVVSTVFPQDAWEESRYGRPKNLD